MKKHILNLRTCTDREALYDAVVSVFDFPDYFGRNLDALYDCLTELSEDTCVAVVLPDCLDGFPEEADDGTRELALLDGADPDFAEYMEKFRRTFEDAEEENPHLVVLVVQ